jgi:hypothetical protein
MRDLNRATVNLGKENISHWAGIEHALPKSIEVKGSKVEGRRGKAQVH